MPRPGQHIPGPPPTVEPQHIHAEVDGLLARLDRDEAIPHQARILEQAHDVLVRALAAVDKI